MSVNEMSIEDACTFLNDVQKEVTGVGQGSGVISGISPANFISVANTMLQMNTDVVYSALMNTITKTVFSTRPYSRQFGGMIVDNLKWGGIIRKIQFGDTEAVTDKAFHDITDGQSVDHYIVNKGDVLETRYYGSDVYQDVMTVFRDQLINAFSGPEQLGSFVAAKANEVNNKWVQWTEDLARSLVLNTVAAKYEYYADTTPTYIHKIPLITLYNTETHSTITYTDIAAGAQAKPFWEWVRAKIRTLQRLFTTRSVLHYTQIGNHKIIRHTPYVNQKVYMLAPYMDLMETSTLSEAFHNDMLKYADYEGVAYWQNPNNPDEVLVNQYTYLNESNGQYENSDDDSVVHVTHLLGLIFDEEMMRINIKDNIIQNTPMNSRGLYFNTWLTAHASYLVDFTEKCCILTLE